MSDNTNININVPAPEIGPYTQLKPFRFWCQKVLPLVYDESLSYYELLCKVVDYLNKTMEDVDQMIVDMGEYRDAYIAFSRQVTQTVEALETYMNNYFTNLDVQNEINNKLDAMAIDGTLTTLVYAAFHDDIAGIVTAWLEDNIYQEYGYMIDKSFTIEDCAADAKLTGDWLRNIDSKLDEYEGVFTADVNESVENWLNEHPEATTSVEDGSLTLAKFADTLKLQTENYYVTPEMFNCVGDGVTDDTFNFRIALKYAIDNNKVLLLPGKYYITSALLNNTDYNTAVTLNIKGIKPLDLSAQYAINNYGGIIFDHGLDLFQTLTLKGSIENVAFMPTERSQTGSIFKGCSLAGFRFENCEVSNILAFCHNTEIISVSQIKNNRFLTVYYFAKCDTIKRGCVDSIISNNYINGGEEMTNNHCFEFDSFNGSIVANNFIDYYQTIYHPYGDTTFGFQGGVSCGNQYQVFRYLYLLTPHCNAIYFNSNGDCFNWTKPTELPKLNSYDKKQYTGHDNEQHDIPESIFIAYNVGNVTISNAIIQSRVGNIAFIRHGASEYSFAHNKLTIAQGIDIAASFANTVKLADSIYNNGQYKLNKIDIPFIRTDMATLPSITLGWNSHYLGELTKVNNHVYKLVADYDTDTSTWAAKWVDVSAEVY
ncbi:MAG: hypothetical protein IKE92_14700 [Clostridiales bacterium]|nr:hypothetical protein [Clostridiales bacterium]